MADYLAFSDLYTEVERSIKHFDSAMTSMVKEMINMVYMNELMVCDDLYPLFWLVDFDDTLKSVDPATITAISQANPGVFTAAAHGYVTGDLVTVHNVVGMTEVNDRIYQLTKVNANSFTLGVDTTGYTAYTSGGTAHHRGKTLATSGKNVQRILAAGWCDKDMMEEITYTEIEKDTTYHYNDTTARPERWYHGKGFTSAGAETNQLIWHPGADDEYVLRYWLEERVSKLANDADVPLLPPQFHHGIVAGAITRLIEAKVQVENAVVWPEIYKMQIKALTSFNRRYWETNEEMKRLKRFLI